MKKLIAASASALLLGVAAAPAAAFINTGLWIQANTTVTKTAVVKASNASLTSQNSTSVGFIALSSNRATTTQSNVVAVVQ